MLAGAASDGRGVHPRTGARRVLNRASEDAGVVPAAVEVGAIAESIAGSVAESVAESVAGSVSGSVSVSVSVRSAEAGVGEAERSDTTEAHHSGPTHDNDRVFRLTDLLAVPLWRSGHVGALFRR